MVCQNIFKGIGHVLWFFFLITAKKFCYSICSLLEAVKITIFYLSNAGQMGPKISNFCAFVHFLDVKKMHIIGGGRRNFLRNFNTFGNFDVMVVGDSKIKN